MHDINKIRQEPDVFCDGLKKKRPRNWYRKDIKDW